MATITFKQFYQQCLHEDMMASTVFGINAPGDKGGQVPGGSDFYNSGSAVIAHALGTTKSRRNRGKTKKPLMQRRNLSMN